MPYPNPFAMGFFDFLSDIPIVGDLLEPIGDLASNIPIVGDAVGGLLKKEGQFKDTQRLYDMQLNSQLALQHDAQNFVREEWTRQFDMTNRYNTFSAQMQRMRAAGLNPNLMLGNGSTSNAVGQSVTSPTPSAPDASSAFSAVANRALIQTQVKNMQEDTEIKHIQAQTELQRRLAEIHKFKMEALQNSNMSGYYYWLSVEQSVKANIAQNTQQEQEQNISESAKKTAQEALEAAENARAATARADQEETRADILEGQAPALKEQPSIQNKTIAQQGDAAIMQGESAKTSAAASVQSAMAATIAASAQDYLAHNPQSFEKWLIETLNACGLSPQDMPNVIKEVGKKLEEVSPKALFKRLQKHVSYETNKLLFGKAVANGTNKWKLRKTSDGRLIYGPRVPHTGGAR